jgi:hypothetical protein
MGRERKPLTQNRLASMLRPLKITPGKVGPENKRLNGYVRSQFDDAFERYLSPDTPLSPSPPLRPDRWTASDEMGTSAISQADNSASVVRSENAKKPNNDGPLSTCPLGAGETGNACVSSAGSDFPYTGPIVTMPDLGPNPLDEHGVPHATKAPPPPLTAGQARDWRDWSLDWATAQRAANHDFTTAHLEAELRIKLRAELPPDEVEAAIKQVVDLLFSS